MESNQNEVLNILRSKLLEMVDILSPAKKVEQEKVVSVNKTKKPRGRPKKNKEEKAPLVEVKDSKFLINNQEDSVDAKYGRKESMSNFKFHNQFNPKKESIKSTEEDKRVAAKFKRSPSRPPAPQQISVKCTNCTRTYMEYEDRVSLSVSSDDEPISNICPRCIKNLRG